MASAALQLLALASLLILLILPDLSLAQLRPPCLSQFILANRACIVLPKVEVSRDLSHVKLQEEDEYDDEEHEDHHGHEHGHGHEQGHGHGHEQGHGHGDEHGHGHGDEHGHGHGNGHEHGHGHGNGHEHGHGQGNGHGHEHRHGYRHDHEHGEEPHANKNCCRWLAEVDEACVCEALLHMPLFLIKAKHTYIIKVGKTCKHEYNCGGI